MSKKSFLDSIQSPSPCSKNWDEMTGDQKVRFCQNCEKNIYNISAMTRKEAKKLLIHSSGKLCIRYERRLDGSVITADDGQKFYRIAGRTTRLAAGVLGASLTLSTLTTNAQTTQTEKSANKSAAVQSPKTKADKTLSQISFTLLDPAGAPIPAFRVQLINEKTKKNFTALTDASGVAHFNAVPCGGYKILVEAQSGFQGFNANIEIKEPIEPNVKINLQVGAIVGVFVFDWSEIPLFRAIAQDDNETVKHLITSGFDVNTKDKNGQTALHVAAEHANLEIVRLLLDKGAKVNVKDKSKRAPIEMLFSSGEDDEKITLEILRLFVSKGADIDFRDEDGETLLMNACEDDNLEGVKFLLDLGANPNLKNDEGKTAVELTDSDEIKRLLVRYGARVEN